ETALYHRVESGVSNLADWTHSADDSSAVRSVHQTVTGREPSGVICSLRLCERVLLDDELGFSPRLLQRGAELRDNCIVFTIERLQIQLRDKPTIGSVRNEP